MVQNVFLVIRMNDAPHQRGVSHELFLRIAGGQLARRRHVQKSAIRPSPIFPIIGKVRHGPETLLACCEFVGGHPEFFKQRTNGSDPGEYCHGNAKPYQFVRDIRRISALRNQQQNMRPAQHHPRQPQGQQDPGPSPARLRDKAQRQDGRGDLKQHRTYYYPIDHAPSSN